MQCLWIQSGMCKRVMHIIYACMRASSILPVASKDMSRFKTCKKKNLSADNNGVFIDLIIIISLLWVFKLTFEQKELVTCLRSKHLLIEIRILVI